MALAGWAKSTWPTIGASGVRSALKFLPPDRRRDADSRARLFREAQAASLLQSPHIAVTYDLVEHEGAMFIAMEYVDGELISERIAGGRCRCAEAVDIAAQVADALDEAHGTRRHPSRHQERQPDSDQARSREGARLRSGEDGSAGLG